MNRFDDFDYGPKSGGNGAPVMSSNYFRKDGALEELWENTVDTATSMAAAEQHSLYRRRRSVLC